MERLNRRIVSWIGAAGVHRSLPSHIYNLRKRSAPLASCQGADLFAFDVACNALLN